MAMFIANRIMDGTFTFKQIFATKTYRRWLEQVKTILVAEGREELIEEVEE